MTPGDFLYAPFQRPARPVRVLGIDPGTEGGLSLFVGARPEVLRAMPVIYVPGQGRPRRSKAGKMVAPRGVPEAPILGKTENPGDCWRPRTVAARRRLAYWQARHSS